MVSHGTIFWTELTTSDLDAAKAFYGAIFGWTFEEITTPVGSYTLARRPGQARPVAGLIAWPEGESSADLWFTYMAVDDIDDALATIAASGGRATPIYEVPGVGCFSTVTDPTGSTFGIVQRAPKL